MKPTSQGTLTEEICENGLVFDGYGDIHNHCNYNWAVDCGKRVYDDTPISSPGCLYQFGIYPVGEGCQTTFFKVKMSKVKICNCQNVNIHSNPQPKIIISKKVFNVQEGALVRTEL